MHSCHFLFDHFQFTLIHGPNIPASYAILFFIASDFTYIISHIHSWALFALWLYLFILSEVISPLISCSILGTYQPGRNEEMEPKQKQHLVVDMTADGSKVQCCKELYCIGTWNTMILNGLPWKRTEVILSFLRLHTSTAFQTLLLTMRAIPFLLRDSCSLSVQFSRPVVSDSLRPRGLQHTRFLCPSQTVRVYPNSCPSSW